MAEALRIGGIEDALAGDPDDDLEELLSWPISLILQYWKRRSGRVGFTPPQVPPVQQVEVPVLRP